MAHTLAPLPYPSNALEPHIDQQTMEIHHGRHHNAYVTNLNNAIAGQADLEAMSIEDPCKNIPKLPDHVQGPGRNHGRGQLHHTVLRTLMGPDPGRPPPGLLAPTAGPSGAWGSEGSRWWFSPSGALISHSSIGELDNIHADLFAKKVKNALS